MFKFSIHVKTCARCVFNECLMFKTCSCFLAACISIPIRPPIQHFQYLNDSTTKENSFQGLCMKHQKMLGHL